MEDTNLSFNYAFRGENNYFSSGVSFLLYQTEKKTRYQIGIFSKFLKQKTECIAINMLVML